MLAAQLVALEGMVHDKVGSGLECVVVTLQIVLISMYFKIYQILSLWCVAAQLVVVEGMVYEPHHNRHPPLHTHHPR